MPLLEYRRYRFCQIARDGEDSKNAYVFEKFAHIGQVIWALKPEIETPADDPPNPDEWERWTVESIGPLVFGDNLTTEEKQQTLSEWRY